MRIHPVFHISLLEPVLKNAKQGPIHIHKEIQALLYDVDYIMKHKMEPGGPHYLIYWKGYQHSEDMWELEEHLTSDLIQEYH